MDTQNSASTADKIAVPGVPPADAMDPRKLARLDFGMFTTLRSLGTPKERVCSTLGLSQADYDYLSRLA